MRGGGGLVGRGRGRLDGGECSATLRLNKPPRPPSAMEVTAFGGGEERGCSGRTGCPAKRGLIGIFGLSH